MHRFTPFLIRYAAMFRISPEEVTGKSRDQFLFFLRVILAKELRKKGMRKYEIAAALNRRKSTAIYYLKQYEICRKQDQKFNNYQQFFKNNNNAWRISKLKQRRRKIYLQSQALQRKMNL